MKLRFEKDTLAYATNATQGVANPQSSLPILGNILIDARRDGVVFTASDMESCVRCTVKGEVEKAGRVTVPARTFHSIVRELPAGAVVELDFSSALASISSGDNQYQLTTQSPEDFPAWPDLQAGTTLSLEQSTLKRILGNILFALPQRDPRKVLLGALFDVKDNELIVVATDGKKLGLSRCDVPEISGVQPTSAIIPHKILNEVFHNLRDEGTARLLLGERQVAFDMGDLVYLSNRIDGIFPNYEMVVPTEFNKIIRLNRAAFIDAVRRAAIISEEHNNSIVMRFEAGRVSFNSRTFEVGSYQGALEIGYDGDPFVIAFNHAYLTDTFKVIGGDEVLMKVKQNAAPVVFVQPDDDKSLFLVMPIKLTDIAEFGEQE